MRSTGRQHILTCMHPHLHVMDDGLMLVGYICIPNLVAIVQLERNTYLIKCMRRLALPIVYKRALGAGATCRHMYVRNAMLHAPTACKLWILLLLTHVALCRWPILAHDDEP